MRISEERFAALQAKAKGSGAVVKVSAKQVLLHHVEQKPSPHERMLALGRLPAGTMNDTERAYGELLEGRRFAGEVAWYKFEAIKLRLADNTFYTPDFAVMLATGQMQMHEVKGFWKDDARVKIKVAASIYPFEFVAIRQKSKKDGGGWALEEF